MSGPYTADLPDLQAWARGIIGVRTPDFVIGDDYLRRWWLVPRNDYCNVYLHEFNRSDDDRALHDHPWANTSFVLIGRYREHTADGMIERGEGDVVTRSPETLHRIELYPGEQAITLFITGPKVREWGFACPNGWRHWKDFVDARDSGQVGPGCE